MSGSKAPSTKSEQKQRIEKEFYGKYEAAKTQAIKQKDISDPLKMMELPTEIMTSGRAKVVEVTLPPRS